MKLSEWCKIKGVHHTHPTTERGAVSVILTSLDASEINTQLWHLEDYAVSSRTGVVVWLVPKVRETKPQPPDSGCHTPRFTMAGSYTRTETVAERVAVIRLRDGFVEATQKVPKPVVDAAFGYLSTWAVTDRYHMCRMLGDKEGNIDANYYDKEGNLTYQIGGILREGKDAEGHTVYTYSFHS